MPEAPLDNPTSAQSRQREDAKPESQREPFRQRPVSDDTVPIATTVVENDTVTRTRHVPGTPVAEPEPGESPEPTGPDARKEQPEVSSPAEVYTRDNIVHPGPTIDAVVTDEQVVGEPLATDPEVVLRPVDEPLSPEETAEERLQARKEAVHAERLA